MRFLHSHLVTMPAQGCWTITGPSGMLNPPPPTAAAPHAAPARRGLYGDSGGIPECYEIVTVFLLEDFWPK